MRHTLALAALMAALALAACNKKEEAVPVRGPAPGATEASAASAPLTGPEADVAAAAAANAAAKK